MKCVTDEIRPLHSKPPPQVIDARKPNFKATELVGQEKQFLGFELVVGSPPVFGMPEGDSPGASLGPPE
jgi:hypothetical protein